MKIILHGYAGRMGLEVRKFAETNPDIEIVCGVDAMYSGTDPLCVKSFDDCTATADCIFDFSHHSQTASLIAFALKRKLSIIIATTAHTQEEVKIIENASREIPIFLSSNFSLGIAAMKDLVKRAAAMFPEADIEIIEAHHNRKLDAPSGTAKALFGAIKSVRPDAEAVCGRAGDGKRERQHIGIHAVRMGNYVGVHEVIISTDNETLSIRHQAFSRAVFAEGAAHIAPFILRQPAGLYNMENFIASI